MDALAGLLDGPRAQGAFLLKVVLSPPWSLHIADEAPLAVFTVLDGAAWLVHPALDGPVELTIGSTVVVRGPEHYVVADRPDRAPGMFIGPGGDCRDATGTHLADAMRIGVRTWGNDPAGSTTLLTGAYALDGEVGARLLRALPPALVLHRAEWESPVATLLAAEIGRDEPGQEAVLDRLLDLLLISALRAWFARPDAAPPAWYAANADPLVGRALQLLHHNPARPWTVGSLAAADGRLPRDAGPPLHGARGRAADAVPDRLAAGAGGGPAARPGHDAGRRRAPRRLQQPVRAEHRVQAGSRCEPAGAPRHLGLTAVPYGSSWSPRPTARRMTSPTPTPGSRIRSSGRPATVAAMLN